MQWKIEKSYFRFSIFILKLSFEDQFLIINFQIQNKDPKSGFDKNSKNCLIKNCLSKKFLYMRWNERQLIACFETLMTRLQSYQFLLQATFPCKRALVIKIF